LKLEDIKFREKIKHFYYQKIYEYDYEIKVMEKRKKMPNYDKNRIYLGDIAAISDIDDDIRENIFIALSESYEDSIIRLNKERIIYLKKKMKTSLKYL
jgi:hypothetical protein